VPSTLFVHLCTVGRVGLVALTVHREIVGMLSYQSLFFCSFSDVLCPSVRVEGDRFKHTNGGTKEITGKRDSNTQGCLHVQLTDLRVASLTLLSLVTSPVATSPT